MSAQGETTPLTSDAAAVLRRLADGHGLTVRERVWFTPVPGGGMQNWEVACPYPVFQELLHRGAIDNSFGMFGALDYELSEIGHALIVNDEEQPT